MLSRGEKILVENNVDFDNVQLFKICYKLWPVASRPKVLLVHYTVKDFKLTNWIYIIIINTSNIHNV